MVLDTKNATVAYRCPHCGAAVLSGVNMFTLTADMLKLKCSCGKSEMTLVNTADGKVRLIVPCMLCPKPHQFLLSRSLMFDKELFCMPCPYSDINICCVGEDNHVRAEMARSELELLKLLEENGISDFSTLHPEEAPDEDSFPTDPQVRDIVMFVIHDLDAEGKIYCHCPEGTPHEYDAVIEDDGIRVTCTVCGASRLIPTDSGLAAHAFLHSDSLDLTVTDQTPPGDD